MTSPADIYFVFFALPGFLTLLIIRHVALYKRALSQTEFVFYSLACSIPSYLTAVILVGPTDGSSNAANESHAAAFVIVAQAAFAALYGFMVGAVIRKMWRAGLNRYTPWHTFMSKGEGKRVIVYTSSSKRYFGWIKQASSDDEARREVVLGDPVRLNKDGSKVDMGSEMLFCEDEIARVVRVRFNDDTAR